MVVKRKQDYCPPKIKVVEFKVEVGFGASQDPTQRNTEKFSSSPVSNDGFWGDYVPSGQGTETFGNSQWEW